jgi:hypothetical protein
MCNSRSELAEQAERVEHARRSFAELLPGADVVWGFTAERDGLYVIEQLNFKNIKEVRMIGFFEPIVNTVVDRLVLKYSGHVYQGEEV